jgi:murein DD-endopeptidase MepM/ murein hydrolase activator NlpD
VRQNNYYIMRSRDPRLVVTFKMTILAVVAIGFVGLGAYFCFSATFGNNFPFSCNIPSFPATRHKVSISSQKPRALIPPKTREPLSGSQEIVDLTGHGDTLLSLLSVNLPDLESSTRVANSLASVIQPFLEKTFTVNTVLESSKRYSLILDAKGRFLKATLELAPDKVFHAVREGNAIRSWKEEVVLDYRIETASFVVRDSLQQAVLDAGEGRGLVVKLNDAFRYDIDFSSESRRGDTCKVVFERRYADDRPSDYGDLLYVEYQGKVTGTKIAVRFNNEYFDEKGTELKKNFLRSPLSVTRVTSKFGMRRHPIFKDRRMHKGVDYGAPIGTPVLSIASGVVTFAGWQRGYGKIVHVKHGNGYESRYGHLHKFFVRKGQRIKQTQRLGLVGRTGRCTGPHLDFQLLRANRHIDPLKVKMIKKLRTVPRPLMGRFKSLAKEREQLLSRKNGIVLGRRYATPPRARIN